MTTDLAAIEVAEDPPAEPPVGPTKVGAEITTRLPLPNGQWAELRDYRTLSNRDRRRVLRGMSDDTAAVARGLEMGDLIAALLIVSWSLPHPLPSEDLTVFDELDISTGVAIEQATREPMQVLFPNTNVNPDPASPTQPSSDSEG